MRSTTVFEPDALLAGPPANLQFTNWAIRDNGIVTWIFVVVLFVGVFAAAFVTQSHLVALVGSAALFVTTWRLWIPVEFEFGPRGIVETVMGKRRRIPWAAIGSCKIRRDGVFFSPTIELVPMSALRGIYVGWGNDKEELIAIVKYYLGQRVE